MSEETPSATPAPTTNQETFSIEFEIPADMLPFFAKIGLEVVLKQRMKEISDTVKK